ncbi:MAG TPA: hypothetical protein VKG01_03845 [Thermoanaerobaculia bacterium]|nr:hypothetical protein [Thermoanaerobaculia bacterium]
MTPATEDTGQGLASTMPFRILVDEAMKLTRRHFRWIYFPVAIPVSLLFAALTVVQLAWMRGIQSALTTRSVLAMAGGCGGVLLAFFVLVVAQSLAYTALAFACTGAVERGRVGMKESWRFVLQLRVMGTLVLVWIALGVSFLFFFFPAIYVGLILSLVTQVMAAEKVFGFAAMRRSSQLVRYNPQRRFLANPKVKIFALFVIAMVISYVVRIVVELPFAVFQGYSAAREVAGRGQVDSAAWMSRMMWTQVPSSILSSLVTTAVGVYTSFGLALLYFDIRRRKEGMDLEAEIDRMSGGPPETPPPVAPR